VVPHIQRDDDYKDKGGGGGAKAVRRWLKDGEEAEVDGGWRCEVAVLNGTPSFFFFFFFLRVCQFTYSGAYLKINSWPTHSDSVAEHRGPARILRSIPNPTPTLLQRLSL